MSRSRQSSPCRSHTNAGSGKYFKREANKALRQRSRQSLLHCQDWDAYIPPLIREVSNVYNSPKDGVLHYWVRPSEEEAYCPRTDTYCWEWLTIDAWRKIFRK